LKSNGDYDEFGRMGAGNGREREPKSTRLRHTRDKKEKPPEQLGSGPSQSSKENGTLRVPVSEG